MVGPGGQKQNTCCIYPLSYVPVKMHVNIQVPLVEYSISFYIVR